MFQQKKIGKSHISASADKKNVFSYVMEDVNKSTSETNNIIVDSIKDYSKSPHTIKKSLV